jgi:hypothetical protein
MFVTLDKLRNLDPGNYLLSHKTGEPNIAIYKSEDDSQTDTKQYYDLHQALKNSPSIDLETVPFIPTRWDKPNQIPDTFEINKNLPPQISSPGSKFPAAAEYCPNFSQSGTCNVVGCGLIHAKPSLKQKTKVLQKLFKHVTCCHSFARTGICKAGEEVCPLCDCSDFISANSHIGQPKKWR